MYRRVNSGRWIGITTALIVVVMAVFTWVMYGMARQVFTMTDVMLELNESIKAMVGTQISMASDMGTMTVQITEMNNKFGGMTGDIAVMTEVMGSMAANLNRMTYDINQVTYAIANPMSFMWGNSMPF